MKEVIFVTSKEQLSGSSLQLCDLANLLHDSDTNVEVLAPANANWMCKATESPDIAWRHHSSLVNLEKLLLRNPALVTRRSINTIIHVQKGPELRVCLNVLKKTNSKARLVAHRTVSFPFRGDDLVLYQDPRIDRILAVCHASALQVASQCGIPIEKIAVIRPSIDVDKFAFTRSRSKQCSFQICMVANHHKVKHVEHGLEITKRLSGEMEVRFTSVGDPLDKDLKGLSVQMGIGEICKFWEWSPDPSQFLRMADATLFCSETEGIPATILEAMAVGVPVVSSSVGGISEVVRHGKTGLLYEYGDLATAIRHLKFLRSNPSQAAEMAVRAREFVCSNHKHADLARKVRGLHSNLIELDSRDAT